MIDVVKFLDKKEKEEINIKVIIPKRSLDDIEYLKENDIAIEEIIGEFFEQGEISKIVTALKKNKTKNKRQSS